MNDAILVTTDPASVAARLRALAAALPRHTASLRDAFGRSLGRRFVLTSLALLGVIQAASFFVIDASLHRPAYGALPEQLALGARSLQRLVDWRADKLTESARLLAADFGFRSAVLSNDQETIASVLSNRGERIGASEVALLGTDFSVKALADGNASADVKQPATIARLAAAAAGPGGASDITLGGGVPRERVLLPLKAPILIGWVLLGFALPPSFADEVHTLSATDLSLLSRARAGEDWDATTSRLEPALAAELAGAG